MKTGSQLAAAMLLVVGAACATDTDVTDRPLFDNAVHVFEAQILDGQTGAPIPGATLSIQVGRHVLNATSNQGFYTVYHIPYGTFRVAVTAAGYNEFVAMKAFTNGSSSASLSAGSPLVYYFNNILMYPAGQVPADVRVSVYDGVSGNPVAGATVAATITALTSLVDVTDVLPPQVGLLPTVQITTTSADGKATFPVASLIMGATYSVDVFGALDANGVYLVPATDQTVRVGFNVQELVVFLTRPLLVPVALKVNNEDSAMSSNLQVTFPYAIEVCSKPVDWDWNNSTNSHSGTDDTDLDGVSTTPATDNPVGHTLTVNDTVLTLTYATSEDDAGDDLWVTFQGVTVKPKGASNSSCTNLSGVRLRNTSGGAFMSAEIHVREIP